MQQKDYAKRIFIFAEAVIYMAFLLLDLIQEIPGIRKSIQWNALFPQGTEAIWSERLKFTSILLCVCYVFISAVIKKANGTKIDHILLFLAFLFTAGADIFLLLLGQPLPGVCLFFLVQSIYFVRICPNRAARYYIVHICFRVLAGGILYTCLHLFIPSINEVVLCTAIYMISFIENIVLLAKIREKQAYCKPLFLIGLLLFFLCDVSVGLFNLSDYIAVSSSGLSVFIQLSSIAMWMFYLPGQVCLAVSGK